jgi:hypothetical protein
MKSLVSLALFLALATPALAAGCDNPFFPAKAGSSKTFAIQGKSETYTIRVTNATAAGFTLRYEYTDPVRVLEVPYTCTPQGLTSPSLFSSGFGPDAKVTTQVSKSSGLVIPTAERWRIGASWTYANEGTITADDKTRGQLVYTFKNEITFRVVGQEQVKVPAGTFQAFKVVLSAKGEFGAKGKSMPTSQTLTQWYVKGVGLVRQEVRISSPGGAETTSVHELIRFKS